MLAPSGHVVTEAQAISVMRHKDAGEPNWKIAGMIGCAEGTVKKVVSASRAAGAPRIPRPGTGKLDDPRWVFHGPRGGGSVAALELAEAHGSPDDTYVEVLRRLKQEGLVDTCGYRTLCKAMDTHLDMTIKRVRALPARFPRTLPLTVCNRTPCAVLSIL